MIIELKPYKKEEDKTFENLVKNFNEESIKQVSKYRLMNCDLSAKVIKPLFLNFGNSLGENIIFYDIVNEYFYFYEGILSELFNEIESILNLIPDKFVIEVI